MENKELEKNLDRIAQYDKELANQILMTDFDKSKFLLTQNPNGEYNVVYNNFYLHSNENISQETEQIAALIGEQGNPNVIRVVWGLGLGYLADRVSEMSGTTIIYEPNLDILKFIFSIATIDAIFKDNVYVCADKNKLSNLILTNSNVETKMTINYLPAYKVMFNDEIQETIKTMQVAKGGHDATKNTLLSMSPRALKNTFYNLKNILKNPNIFQLKDIYKGKTAICLSAGPSLRENIEIIRDNQDKFVIFAVNPTIKLLSEFNVKPDFIIDIETTDTSPQFSSINPKDYCFIMETFANSAIYNLETKKTFSYISKMNFANPWVRNCLKIEGELETLGTVSYTALMSAYIMGFKKIILCGQDLAYKNGQCYAKGSQYEELECVFDEEKNKYVIKAKDFDKYAQSFMTKGFDKAKNDKRVKNYIDFLNKNIFTVTGQDGKKIPTQTGYALFIEWFEQAGRKMKAETPDLELINSSTGGAMIEGFENIPLEKIVQELESVEKLDLTSFNGNYDMAYIKLKSKLLFEKLTLYKKVLNELMVVSNRLLKEMKIKKIFTPNILKAIQKQDNYIVELVGAKKDEDLKQIIFFSLCKYSDALTNDCFNDIPKAIATTEKILQISKEADEIYNICLKNLANC